MGIAVGLAVAFLTEGFQMGAQIISLQAGYTFATTIDPTSGADSAVLLTIAQLAAGLLFFATGLDRQILLAFAQSLSTQVPGHFAISPSDGQPPDSGGSVHLLHRVSGWCCRCWRCCSWWRFRWRCWLV